jgi:hypothetical protein
MSDYHLAQVNIATMLAPLDSPTMSGFVNRLDEINALAEGTPGFVWRIKTDGGDATSIRAFDDEKIIINMSVWQTIEALYDYAYYSKHVEVFRKRGEWFERMDTPILALWWIPVGHVPTTDEAKERLSYLEQHGPTPYAFTFKKRFSAEEAVSYMNDRIESASQPTAR